MFIPSLIATVASFAMAFYYSAGYPETVSFFAMVSSIVLLYHTFLFYEGAYNFCGEDMLAYTKTFTYVWMLTSFFFVYLNHYAYNPQFKAWASHFYFFWYIWGAIVFFFACISIAFYDFSWELMKMEFYDVFEEDLYDIKLEKTFEERRAQSKEIAEEAERIRMKKQAAMEEDDCGFAAYLKGELN
jgi:hypothetical protein